MTYENAKQNIRIALDNYFCHANGNICRDDISERFIDRLAHDSVDAKAGLRQLFSQSPAWVPELDAMVINGNRTCDTDWSRVKQLISEIIPDYYKNPDLPIACRLFRNPTALTDTEKLTAIETMNAIAPGAYREGRKLSRVFKAMCVALGCADETAGSEFQWKYAQLADELSAKKIDFKLYVSINPAHFLTMSNPKCDSRGNTLTSCHSFNSTEYEYNNGCSGYARDNVSFIVFTVADPNNPETLNNRKTTRQVFAYRPGSGLLLQSRMYNTSGGTRGQQEDSKLYRDLIQRELSMLENRPNLWQTYPATGDYSNLVKTGYEFGGYADWNYSEFDGKISIRQDCQRETVTPLYVGDWGLCIDCGDECNTGLYCDNCNPGKYTCDHCGEHCDETYVVYDENGNEIEVCDYCRDEYYVYCNHCGYYYHQDTIVFDYQDNYICPDCIDRYYKYCDECQEYYPEQMTVEYYDKYGDTRHVCDDCASEINVITCPNCYQYVEVCKDGTCPDCGHVIVEEEEIA